MPAKAQTSAKSQAARQQRRPPLKGIPKLVISPRAARRKTYDPDAVHLFQYEARAHTELPHVVKFSGGRSSGMMLFTLLEAGMLKPERGDVVIFNNTSAEHPETYRFTRECKEQVEKRYRIPFFWVEFQTYEDARRGQWTRLPSYRLVKPTPWSEDNPDGYHWKGEAFEEMLSWAGFVPNQFQRICTKHLKLKTTRLFLRDWFACKEGIERQGHYGNASRLNDTAMLDRHRRHRGGVPENIFFEKKAYMRSRPFFRPEQRFADFSAVVQPIQNASLDGKSYGNNAYFGENGVEYIAFVGLRYDEMHRVLKVQKRNAGESETGGPELDGYEGEHVYMPLAKMKVAKEDIDNFWAGQKWDLGFSSDAELSNCVFCFLKGVNKLRRAQETMRLNGNGIAADTPCDLEWWKRIENDYGRNLIAEKREIRGNVSGDFIGFFGASSGFSYDLLAQAEQGKDLSQFEGSVLPCDCTD
ncbi:MAG: hypothetical protein OXU53_11550 [Deltaproteobacteria bacterium]|nr:hypothetical protein [Deltaproteobacteria bacterium]